MDTLEFGFSFSSSSLRSTDFDSDGLLSETLDDETLDEELLRSPVIEHSELLSFKPNDFFTS